MIHIKNCKLKQISNLKDNWNENGAKGFTKEHLKKVEKIIELLSKEPAIFPTAMESIQLEYESEYGYLEINVFKDKIEIYFEDKLE